MKFIVSSSTLLNGLQSVSGVLGTNSTLPILDNFLFKLESNRLVISASDIETSITVDVPLVMSESEGSIAVPAKILLNTLKTLPDTPISFNIDVVNKTIELTTDTGSFKNVGFDADEFPVAPQIEDPTTISIPAEHLLHGINKTHFATGNDEMRPVMMGVNFEITTRGIILVGTDAHKLVRYIRRDVVSENEDSFILPKKPLNLLRSALGSAVDDVKIEYNKTNVRFTFGNIIMTSRLVQGKYPNYEAVIPLENPNVLIVDRVLFMNTLRRVAIYSNQSTLQVRLRISGQMMEVSAEDLDYANAGVEKLNVSYSGEDLEIGFNSKFLVEMLNNLDAKQLQIEMSTPGRAGIIVPVDKDDENEDILMLVMPIMLNS